MKTILSCVLLAASMVSIGQNLPKLSQKAEVEQMVGMTEIEVEYFRPNMNGRAIFGELIKFDEVWRTGANSATVISFSTDVKINDKSIEAGDYALFTKPGAEAWQIMLNQDHEQWGAYNYDAEKDVISFSEDVQSLSNAVESFSISFENVKPTSVDVCIAWEKTKVSFQVEVEVDDLVEKEIASALKDTANVKADVYLNAANYFYKRENHKLASSYVKSALKENDQLWNAYWLQARMAEKKEDYKNAVKFGNKAIEVGEKVLGDEFGYSDRLKEIIGEWEAK